LEVIGLPEDAKPESMQVNLGFFMKVQDGQIHVIQEDANIDRSATKAHIGLNVGSIEFLRACRGRLEAAGIKTSEMPHFPGYERYDFRDPFGNRLEFIAALPS
jgi:catechol 2,3-dioxygenase-like lactoylglutathione lyase family enzyme